MVNYTQLLTYSPIIALVVAIIGSFIAHKKGVTGKDLTIFWLKTPVILIVISSFAASIYAAKVGLANIQYGTGILLGLAIAAYFVGVYLNFKKNKIEAKR